MSEAIRLISVLRHGQVDGPPFVFRGSTDTPLSAEGRRQMLAVLTCLPHAEFRSVASSPLQRCASFAAEFASQRNLSLQIESGFREREFGLWEGLDGDRVASRFAEEYGRFRATSGAVEPPRGESLDTLHARVVSAWEAWMGALHPGAHLLVTHAGVMRVLLMHLIGLPAEHAYRIALPDAASFQVSCLPGVQPVLLNLNQGVDAWR